MLTDKQAGHIRHMRNLMAQPDGDWSHMDSMEAGQEGLSSYRYQLGHIVYALGLAHFHHLPAAPCVFKEAMQAAIRKMRRREVWGYWYEASQSDKRIDPDLEERREQWHDPVVKENIMYSGHLHAMAGMYGVLFDDDRYEREGGLTIRHSPLFVGEEMEFSYDFSSINDIIYWQMVENGWLGVACEPNCIFLVCNQFPMLGFRFHDIRKGTSIAEEAAAGYRQAWQDRDALDRPGTMPMMLMVRQNVLVPGGPATDSHTGAIMHAWNRDFVREHRQSQVYHALKTAEDGTVSLRPLAMLPGTAESYEEAGKDAALDELAVQWSTPDFGTVLMWLSELGDSETLFAMFAHADKYMNPSWEKGGLYYPRNDRSYDEEGNLTFVEPLTGNVLAGYARLNVPDGLWKLYNHPWGKEHFRQPHLAECPFELDVLQARYDEQQNMLSLTLRPAIEEKVDARLLLANPGGGPCEILRDGKAFTTGEGDSIELRLTIDAQTDLQLVQGSGS
ncbi:hypothetical protein [Aurantiacibacter suaedae]|uniref:linalool dehydratase/isomerase domain-containing protein n=1 Tax=Aurantiacibacter suaedae TaxID=2545755 RepID=UPI0010F70D78|nr:hypothetical protein [Aurantiacibacter suaedae]